MDKALMNDAFLRRIDGDKPLLMTLKEFFNDNTDEWSIAHNQWKFERHLLQKLGRSCAK